MYNNTSKLNIGKVLGSSLVNSMYLVPPHVYFPTSSLWPEIFFLVESVLLPQFDNNKVLIVHVTVDDDVSLILFTVLVNYERHFADIRVTVSKTKKWQYYCVGSKTRCLSCITNIN
jgi:hypothetical protein